MTSETTRRTGRVKLAGAFGDLARQVMPFAAASASVGETGPGSLLNRAAQVYGGRDRSGPRSRPEQDRLPRRN